MWWSQAPEADRGEQPSELAMGENPCFQQQLATGIHNCLKRRQNNEERKERLLTGRVATTVQQYYQPRGVPAHDT